MYSGWDAAIYVNEETKDKETNPGRAAIASVIILLFVYCLITFAYQGVLSRTDLQSSAGNSLAVIADCLLPGPSSLVLSLVVLLGTIACLQVAVVSSTRLGFAMAEDRVMPAFFKIIHPRTGSPWPVTLFMGGVVYVVFLFLTTFEAGGTREVLEHRRRPRNHRIPLLRPDGHCCRLAVSSGTAGKCRKLHSWRSLARAGSNLIGSPPQSHAGQDNTGTQEPYYSNEGKQVRLFD